jgi:TonB family protein
MANPAPASVYPGMSVDGTLRGLAEKDLLLQTSSGKVLRFRLIPKTEFRGNDGKPVRDSLINLGDRIAVDVNPDDVETAIYVILIAPGSSSEREAGSIPVEEGYIAAPDPRDFGAAHSLAQGNTDSPPGERPQAPMANGRDGAGSNGDSLGGAGAAGIGPRPGAGGGVTGDVFSIGDGVTPPVVISRVDPVYPEEARQAKRGGTVQLSVIVDTEGRARDIHVTVGLGMGLDEKAIEAVEQWKFKPGMKVGRAVNTRVAIEVFFRLL